MGARFRRTRGRTHAAAHRRALAWIATASLSAALSAAASEELPHLPETLDAETPSAACSAFLPDDRPACSERLAAYRDAVAALEAQRAQAGPTQACLLHCDLLEQSWQLRRDTQQWSERAVRSMASGAYERRNQAMAALEARRTALREERAGVAAELADLRKGRVIHLYQDDDTGELVEHAGDRFEAKPPLRYVGEKRVPQLETGQRRIAEREARVAELDAQLAALREQAAPLAGDPERTAATEEMIERMWGDACSPAEADAWLAACRGGCHGVPADPALRACVQ